MKIILTDGRVFKTPLYLEGWGWKNKKKEGRRPINSSQVREINQWQVQEERKGRVLNK